MKNFLIALAAIIALASCNQEQNPFEWSKNRIGHITDSTQVYQLEALFKNDSIVKPIKGDEFSNGPADIEIYEKGGKHLLTLTPVEEDSTATIEYIKIHDERYTTSKGINIKSSFKQINEAYKVNSIDNMIMDAVIHVDDENFYFTIDKDDLPNEVKFDMNATIEKNMIPDHVVPMSMLVTW